jgi:hypothetical protein
MKSIKSFFVAALLVMPLISSGAPVQAPNSFRSLVNMVNEFIGLLIIFIFGLTFVVFMWGMARKWIMGGGDPENVASGKKIVMAGIIGLVVMSSIWGILRLLQSSIFGFGYGF